MFGVLVSLTWGAWWQRIIASAPTDDLANHDEVVEHPFVNKNLPLCINTLLVQRTTTQRLDDVETILFDPDVELAVKPLLDPLIHDLLGMIDRLCDLWKLHLLVQQERLD